MTMILKEIYDNNKRKQKKAPVSKEPTNGILPSGLKNVHFQKNYTNNHSQRFRCNFRGNIRTDILFRKANCNLYFLCIPMLRVWQDMIYESHFFRLFRNLPRFICFTHLTLKHFDNCTQQMHLKCSS